MPPAPPEGARRGNHPTPEGERLLKSDRCRLLSVDEDVRQAAWDLFVRYDDPVFSFTDCTSFALLRAMGIDEAFTFDHRDFSAAGYVVLPA